MSTVQLVPLFSDIRLRDLLKARGATVVGCGNPGGYGDYLHAPRLLPETLSVAFPEADGDSETGERGDATEHSPALVTASLSFDGDPILLRCRPSKYAFSPPKAAVIGSELRLTYEMQGLSVDDLAHRLSVDIHDINQWLSWLEHDLENGDSASGLIGASDQGQ